jgi:integrase
MATVVDASLEFEHYISEHETLKGTSPKTIAIYKLRVGPYVAAHGFGDRSALVEHLKLYRNDRTRSQAFRSIKSFIRWAADLKICEDYISGLHPRFAAAPQREPLTVDDLAAILAAAPDTLAGRRNRVLYWALLYTGARRDAIRLLTWSRVNLDDSSISFTTKAGVQQAIPIASHCRDLIAAWRAECPSKVLVFPSTRRPERSIDARYISHQLRYLALVARFPRPVNVHLLRHSHVVIMADAGVPYETIRLSTGHTTNTMLAHYDRRNPARLRRALKSVFG